MSKHHAKDQMMQAHINQWHASGLTQTEYCIDTSLKLDNFNYYKKKFALRKSGVNQNHQLIPVKILENDAKIIPSINLQHKNGFSLEINPADDINQLKPLLILLSAIE